MADTKISARTAASALTGAEKFPLVQGGNDRYGDIDQVKTYIYTAPTEDNLGSITWDGTPPGSLTQAKYRWWQVGEIASIQWRAEYGSAGTSNTLATFALPAACPTPSDFTGQGTSEFAVPGYGNVATGVAGTLLASNTYLNKGSTGNYIISQKHQSGGVAFIQGQINYVTT